MSLQIKKELQGDDTIVLPDTQSVSGYLKSCRLQKKIELSSVSQALRIRQDFLVALENGNINNLPERVYTLGFVRSYARFLDIDIESTLERFKLEVLGDAHQPVYSLPVPINENTTPNKWLVLFSATVGLLILAGWFFFLNDTSHSEKILPVPKPIQEAFTQPPLETQHTDVHVQEKREEEHPIKSNTEETPQPLPVTDNNIPHFSLIEPTWIEIKDLNSKILEKKVFQIGESLPAYPFEVELTIGNAGGVLISQNNETHPLGKVGAVIRGLRIQPKNKYPSL